MEARRREIWQSIFGHTLFKMGEKVDFKGYNVEEGGLKLNIFFNNYKFISVCIMYERIEK